MSLRTSLERHGAHLVFGSRTWVTKQVRAIAQAQPSTARVLEIGSGRTDLGAEAYSMRPLFDQDLEFVKSDVNPEFGHQVVDITTMTLSSEFDLILCVSVLEHVPNFWEAIPRLREALRPGGTLVLSVPMVFPYHDEPHDFYRFTTHGLRELLSEFSTVRTRSRGPRRLPFTVLATAVR